MSHHDRRRPLGWLIRDSGSLVTIPFVTGPVSGRKGGSLSKALRHHCLDRQAVGQPFPCEVVPARIQRAFELHTQKANHSTRLSLEMDPLLRGAGEASNSVISAKFCPSELRLYVVS
jgi:hypothetical protein